MSRFGTTLASPGELDDREDCELVLAVNNGDTGAFAVLYRRYRRKAYGAAARWSGSPVQRDDIVAEAFGRLLAALQNGGGPRGDFFPYLQRVIRHVAVDQARQERLVELYEDLDLLASSMPPTDPVIQAWQCEIVAKAFASLSPRWQEVLRCVEIEGLRPAAVAQQLKLSPNTVAALAYRARQGLRQAFLKMEGMADAR